MRKPAARFEMNDPNSHPAITAKRDNMAEYDVIFVGFPIWWHVVPTVINTLLESYDLSSKVIVPFATSGGSGMGQINARLVPSYKGAKLLTGKVFKQGASHKELADWAEQLKRQS